MSAYRNYTNNNSALAGNLEKLSSGYKINRAGDDAAGLAISEKMRAQITGLSAAQKNVKDGTSLVKTAEGAMQEIHDMLNRMDYLATQSANGTYDDEVDRANLQKEVESLKAEINRIADSANFNGIKLLDGSLDADGTASITTEAVQITDHAAVKGITVGEVEQGGGSKGTYTISIDHLFGNNDKLSITWGQGSGFDAAASAGATDTTALNGQTTTLTFDSDDAAYTSLNAGTFTGTTREEQAQSIVSVLSQDGNLSAQFDIKAEGSKVILTNKNEGNDQATASAVKTEVVANTANKKGALKAATETAAKAGTAGKLTYTNMFKTSGGMEFNVGDTLTFEATDANGNKWTAELELTDKIVSKTDDSTTHDNIVTELGKIYFKANDKTAAAEENIKFSDIFGIGKTADGNSLELTIKDAGGVFATGGTATVKSSSGKSVNGAVTGVTAGTAGTYQVELETTGNPDTDFSVGDKLSIEGTLSDGRTFKKELVAGTDFEIGAAHTNTVDNIVAALTKGSGTVDVTDADGNVEQVELSKIFSGTANKNEILVANASGKLKFTSQVEGNAFNGSITKVDLTPAEAGSVTPDLRNGVQKSAASASITFDDTLEEGATVTVDGKTYQFVTDAAKAEAGNTAVVVGDLKDSAKTAEAFANMLNSEAGDTPAYTAKVEGSTVTITTTGKGQDVKAPVIEGAGVAHKDAVFKLQPNKLKTGSAITINGQKFEFVNTKDTDAKVSDGSIRVDVDLTKGDTVEINKALKDAIAGAGVADVESVEMAEDGTITIHGANGEMENFVTFDNGKALTLQIGDTSDSFNQLSVSVGDMHTWALEIDGIDIGNQDGAQAAIDIIKDAINQVSSVRGDLGAIQNRLDHTSNNLSVMAENIQDAESAIRDTDVAEEMMSYVKNNILVQSAQAMLAQANQLPQGVLQLLG